MELAFETEEEVEKLLKILDVRTISRIQEALALLKADAICSHSWGRELRMLLGVLLGTQNVKTIADVEDYYLALSQYIQLLPCQ